LTNIDGLREAEAGQFVNSIFFGLGWLGLVVGTQDVQEFGARPKHIVAALISNFSRHLFSSNSSSLYRKIDHQI
jgi:hypothetical protein